MLRTESPGARRALDGNRDGNVASQRQASAAAGSRTLLLSRADLGIRSTSKAEGRQFDPAPDHHL